METFVTYLLDLLGELAGGRGDPADDLARFALSSIFWAILWVSALRERWRRPQSRELLLLTAFAVGFLHALFMLAVKSLKLYGVVSASSLELFFPPIDHALTLLVRTAIAAAFMLYLFESRLLAYCYLAIGSLLSLALYAVIAPLWWATVEAAPEGIKFSHVWMDFADHGLGATLTIAAIALFCRATGWVRTAICIAFGMFLLDDLIMLFNLASNEIHKPVLTPIRHNLQLWAIPLFGYIYWREQREENERLVIQQQQSWRLGVVGKLANGVAHDFNNHLQVILGLSELAKLQSDSPSLQDKSLDQIGETSERATTLVKQLLAFSRRPNNAQFESIQLNDLITEISPMLLILSGDEVTVNQKLDPLLPTVTAERSVLEQLVINLTTNARDAMPDGGVLTILTDSVLLTESNLIGKKSMDTYIRLIISDTGMGMNSNTLDQAVEPFFSTKPFAQGAGLGLTEVHHNITKYGGKITIDSKPNQGTTVTVVFPGDQS